MNTLSFNTANFVARQVDYQMTGGWGQGDRTTNEYFKPIETFGERFETYLNDVRDAGFSAIDLWTSILNPEWATDQHIQTALRILDEQNLTVVSLAGWFGSTEEELERTCKLAAAFGQPVLGGSTSVLQKDRGAVVRLLKQYNLKLGLENHPEKSSAVMMEKIGDGGDGTIGACVDTGWFGTQDYSAPQALEELKDYLFLVHLKDVLSAGEHNTCRFGEGIVDIEGCVRTLQRIGYTGAISIEHEPEMYDPMPDIIAGREMVEGWLS